MTEHARIRKAGGSRRASSRAGRRKSPRAARYFAFLSYSHKDSGLADWLHRELERFRVPASLVGRITEHGAIPRRLTPIFRDERELAAATDLGEEIEEALDKIGYELKERDIVLIHTGAGAYNTDERYKTDFPGMTAEATRHLIAKGVRMMGCDAITFDPPVWAMFERKQFWEAHRVMWDEEYWHLENLMNLELIGRPHGFKLCVLPVKWTATTAAPVRAIAIVED